MAAACTIPKEKLQCKFCGTQNSHNTAACIKKQKSDTEKKRGKIKTAKRIQILRLKQNPKKEEMHQLKEREISLFQGIIDPLREGTLHVPRYECKTWEIIHQAHTVTLTRMTTILLQKHWTQIMILKRKMTTLTCQKILMKKYQKMKTSKIFKIGRRMTQQ